LLTTKSASLMSAIFQVVSINGFCGQKALFALYVFDWLDNRPALTLLGYSPGETDVAATARRPDLGPRTPRTHLQSVNYTPVELVHREAWDIAS